MLWTIYGYYFIFNITLFIVVLFLLRKLFLNSLVSNIFYSYVNQFFLLISLFIFFFIFSLLNYSMDIYQSFLMVNLHDTEIGVTYIVDKLYHSNSSIYNLTKVYYYPFIYVFVLITFLSIIFCLTYNQDELSSFMFYVMLILIAGYTMFFTNSAILFFFSYEMLLLPSFFILYKFAKTRRCVEAAYLMFF